MSPLKKALATVVLAGVTAGSVVTPSPAMAVDPIFPTPYANVAFPDNGLTGAYIDCPPGMLALSAGAVATDHDAVLRSSLITYAGTGAFASAYGHAPKTFHVGVECVPAAKLRGATVASFTVRDHQGVPGKHYRKVTCPDGTVAFGGGGTVYDGGVYQLDGLQTYASIPGVVSWAYGGGGTLGGTRSLSVETHCLPRAQLGRIVGVTKTVTGGDQPRSRVAATALCPEGTFAFAGGAWFQQKGGLTPEWVGALNQSQMTYVDRGWSAAGVTYGRSVQLTAKVLCTDRLG